MNSFKTYIFNDYKQNKRKVILDTFNKCFDEPLLEIFTEELHVVLNEGFLGDISDAFQSSMQKFKDKRTEAKFQKTANKLINQLKKKLAKTQKKTDKAFPALMDAYKQRINVLNEIIQEVEKDYPEFKDMVQEMVNAKMAETQEAINAIQEMEGTLRGSGDITGKAVEDLEVDEDAIDLEGEGGPKLDPDDAVRQAIQSAKELDIKKANSTLTQIKKAFGSKFDQAYKFVHDKIDQIPIVQKLPHKWRNHLIMIALMYGVSNAVGAMMSDSGDALGLSGDEMQQAEELAKNVDADQLKDMVQNPDEISDLLNVDVSQGSDVDILSDIFSNETGRLNSNPKFIEFLQDNVVGQNADGYPIAELDIGGQTINVPVGGRASSKVYENLKELIDGNITPEQFQSQSTKAYNLAAKMAADMGNKVNIVDNPFEVIGSGKSNVASAPVQPQNFKLTPGQSGVSSFEESDMRSTVKGILS